MNACIFIAFFYVIHITCKGGFQLFIGKTPNLLIVVPAVKRILAVFKIALLAATQFCHELTEIGFGAFGVDIQHFFAVFVGRIPVAVLQEHKCTFQKRRSIGISTADYRFFDNGCFWRVCLSNLLNAADEILHKTEFRHILRLQMRKFLRQVIRIHVAVCGNENLLGSVFNKRKITAPFIFHPYGIEVFLSCAEHDHDL